MRRRRRAARQPRLAHASARGAGGEAQPEAVFAVALVPGAAAQAQPIAFTSGLSGSIELLIGCLVITDSIDILI